MLNVGPMGLFGVATISVVVAWGLDGAAANAKGPLKICVAKLLRALAVASVIAAIALMRVASSSSLGLGTTRDQMDGLEPEKLNELVEICEHWSERLWLVVCCGVAAILTGIATGWIHIRASRMEGAVPMLRWLTTSKLVFGLLACVTFIGGGLVSDAGEKKHDALLVKSEADEARVALGRKIHEIAVRDAIRVFVADAAASSAAVHNVVLAHSIAREVMGPIPPTSPAGRLISDSKPQQTPAASLNEIRHASDLYSSNGISDDELVNELTELSVSGPASELVQKHLFGIGNPVINELVAALTNPAFRRALNQFLPPIELEALAKRFGPEQLRQRVAAAMLPLQVLLTSLPKVEELESTSAFAYVRPLGEPKWEHMRRRWSRAVLEREVQYDPDVLADAQITMSDFDKVWGALGVLRTNGPADPEQDEVAFMRYVQQKPDFAAMWGYVVISLQSNSGNDDPDFVHFVLQESNDHEMPRKIRRFMKRAAEGDPKAMQELHNIGITNFDGTQWTDNQLRSRLFASHGPYPIDGYAYWAVRNNVPIAAAWDRYSNPPVSDWVGWFCPAVHHPNQEISPRHAHDGHRPRDALTAPRGDSTGRPSASKFDLHLDPKAGKQSEQMRRLIKDKELEDPSAQEDRDSRK